MDTVNRQHSIVICSYSPACNPITYISIGLGHILHKSKILNEIAYGKF